MTTVFVALIIGGQAWGIISQVNTPDKEPDYYEILGYAYNCDPLQIPQRLDVYDNHFLTRNPFKWWAACAGFQYFNHNIKVIPLIFNIGCLPMVYLVALRLTKDRLVGILSLVAFIYNPLYSDWKASGTYDNIWSFFLLLSVYLASTKIKPIAYLASIASKSVAIMYLPAWLFGIYKETKKISHAIILGCIIVSCAIIASQFLNFVGANIGFYPERWEDAVFRNISVLWQVIPFLALFVVVSRNFIPKVKIPNEGTVWAWILCGLLQNPIVYFFTMQDTYSYRYVPFAAFMSIFIAMTIVNMGNWYIERQMAKEPPKVFNKVNQE